MLIRVQLADPSCLVAILCLYIILSDTIHSCWHLRMDDADRWVGSLKAFSCGLRYVDSEDDLYLLETIFKPFSNSLIK